jgi:hypothetical protein
MQYPEHRIILSLCYKLYNKTTNNVYKIYKMLKLQLMLLKKQLNRPEIN